MFWCGSGGALSGGDAARMLQLARWSVLELPLFTLTAMGTHLVMSASQTLFHYGLGHHRLGGVFFRNHIRFHHTYYARSHLAMPEAISCHPRSAVKKATTPRTF